MHLGIEDQETITPAISSGMTFIKSAVTIPILNTLCKEIP